MNTETQNTKGEFYNEISEIVTEKEAWELILNSDDFEAELEMKKEVRAELQREWMASGISSFEGFFLRSDGMVELQD